MKIHFVLPQLLPFYGMEKAASLLMLALSDAGWDVSATVMSGDVPPAVKGLRIRRLDIATGTLRLAKAAPALKRDLAGVPQGAVIVASGLWAAFPVGLALTGTGRSYVGWEHSALPARLKIDKRVAALFAVTGKRPLRPGRVIAVSDGVSRTVAERWGRVETTTIPNIVEVPPVSPVARPAASGEVRLLTTGAFRPYKNNVCAIEALQYLPANYTLSMAGDGAQGEMLRARVAALGLATRVNFLGRVTGVRELLDASDLLVHPSLSETFGFSLFEAADAGLPVVTLPIAATDELVPKYVPGVLAGAKTVESFAGAVQSAASREWSSSEITQAWKRRRTDMSAEAVAGRWQAVLSGVPR